MSEKTTGRQMKEEEPRGENSSEEIKTEKKQRLARRRKENQS
jgi:hypothetical protein